VTHWRRLRFWEKRSRLLRVWRQTLSLLYTAGTLNLTLSSLDGTLVPSFSFNETTGYSGRKQQTGSKLSTLTDKEGLPIALVFAPGNRHDQSLAERTMKRLKAGSRRRPDLLLADKGYDGKAFRRSLRKRGIKANIPERTFKKRRKRGRPPSYSKSLGRKRYVVERTNAWLKSFRRVHFRYDKTISSFRAFVLLACVVVCVRRLID
jgi:transposase